MVRLKKMLTSMLIAVLVIAGSIPAFTAESCAASQDSIIYGRSNIGTQLVKGNKVWFGSSESAYEGLPLWRVGSAKESCTEDKNGMFLVSEHVWKVPGKTMSFMGLNVTAKTPEEAKNLSNSWQGSFAQSWCNSFYNSGVFSAKDKTHIASYAKTDKTGSCYAATWDACSLTTSDKVFFPSVFELWKYVNQNYPKATDIYGNGTPYWTRSPHTMNGYANQVGKVDGLIGGVAYNRVDMSEETGSANDGPLTTLQYAYRPALNLIVSDLLFASSAGAMTSTSLGVKPVGSSDGTFKLTFKDPSRTVTAGSATNDGKNISFSFSGATTGSSKDYVSAFVYGNNKVKYYGKIANNSSSGTATIPASYMSGTDKLYLVSEQNNGEKATDYASEPVMVNVPDPPQPEPAPETSGADSISNDTAKASAEAAAQQEWTGNYSASVPKAKSVKARSTKKGRIKVTWKKASKKKLKKFNKVEIQICTDKAFPRDVTVRKEIKKKKTSASFKGLKRKTTYYVRVRNVSGSGSGKNVSAWSKTRKVKTK